MDKNITNCFLKITNPQLQKNAFYNYDGLIVGFDFETEILY